MFTSLLLLVLTAGSLQKEPPTVHRVFVATDRNASIVFEYANAAFPEDREIPPGTVECFVSKLISTGMFSDVRVSLDPVIGKENRVDVNIAPVWSRTNLTIREITVEGFSTVDTDQLLASLRQKGLRPDVPILRYPLPSIRNLVIESVREIHKADSKRTQDVEEEISDVSFRVELVTQESVRLRLVKDPGIECRPLTTGHR